MVTVWDIALNVVRYIIAGGFALWITASIGSQLPAEWANGLTSPATFMVMGHPALIFGLTLMFFFVFEVVYGLLGGKAN